ncbi:hypothetical protein H4W34_001961 [Actinomadura algeriensis]|uniref:LysR substrate binding domain-containing protein n=1 Tax=Actinomadura algeriensis TaxID=1679523 RepID=A0ABR9JNZ4_9ACTN|nr:hypothetical protein [Actinomadura algeriensis]
MAHLWLPVRGPDITVGPITHTSPIVIAMASTHPHADRESISLEDYGDLTFVAHESPYLPVRDAPPCRWAFAWHASNTTPLLRDFIATIAT